ncbi:hypothetical protein [Streptomyces sp. VNUA24]|uniref:hypothetical protein n=1 Tax=Streptomyces sp. VNUA24 TaxID=3031131 RepID=UPI0023B8763E|nr:hypothetical protein [Streptomyces sp. VNUA24]WEH14137.1 hypothetical protein PYR72_10585 [Streptomyces sp. VNUA24]
MSLHDTPTGGGRRLIFSDSYWHNLNEYGFDDQTSSWRNKPGFQPAGPARP